MFSQVSDLAHGPLVLFSMHSRCYLQKTKMIGIYCITEIELFHYILLCIKCISYNLRAGLSLSFLVQGLDPIGLGKLIINVFGQFGKFNSHTMIFMKKTVKI